MATMKVLVGDEYVPMPYYAAHYFAGNADLNLAVVGGTTAPENPAENTFWINTGTAIPEWQFSAAEPTSRTDGTPLGGGEVWIATNNRGAVTINALKGNGIVLHPNGAHQYVGGAWEYKEAMYFANGTWLSLWNGELYDAGNDFAGITGGWVKSYGNGGALTINTNNMVMSSDSEQNGFSVENDLNAHFEKYSTLKVKVSKFTKSSSGFFSVVFHSDKTYGAGSNISINKFADATSAATVYEIPIPAESPKYFSIVVYFGALTVEKIWME